MININIIDNKSDSDSSNSSQNSKKKINAIIPNKEQQEIAETFLTKNNFSLKKSEKKLILT